MSFLFASLASSSSSSSSSRVVYVPRRALTERELKIQIYLVELYGFLGSIISGTLLAFVILFIGNGVLKASKQDHLSYRDITLVALVGSPIVRSAYEIPSRIYKMLPANMKLPWVVIVDTPLLLWLMFYPAVNGSLCGILGVLLLRTSGNYAELFPPKNVLYVVEAAAIGGGILWAVAMIFMGWSLVPECFHRCEYEFYIGRPRSDQSPQSETRSSKGSDSTIAVQC